MIRSSVSGRYAKALFELLDPDSVEPMRTGLAGLSLAMSESASLKHVVASPAFSEEKKLAVLWELSERVNCPKPVKGFLGLLVAKNRVDQIPGIAEAFADLANRTKGTKEVTVTSAVDLPQADQDRIQRHLLDCIGGEVVVTYHTDPSLLSGLHIQIGSTVFDSTLRNRLAALRTLLTKE